MTAHTESRPSDMSACQPRRRACCGPILCLLLACWWISETAAQQTEPPEPANPPNPVVALNQAIRALTDEARQGREENRLPRQRADFAQSFQHAVDQRQLQRRLSTSLDRDHFVDAYVRWQLTGFVEDPAEMFAGMSDRAFSGFLNNLPRLLPNPRTDRQLIQRLNYAVQVGPLSQRDQTALQEIMRTLGAREREAATLNQAAVELRRWVEAQLGDSGLRPHQARLEHLAAMIHGGWNAEQFKRSLDRHFEQTTRDIDFVPADRRRLAAEMSRLPSDRVVIVRNVRINEGIVELDMDEAAIYDFEVARWIRALTPP